MQDRAIEAGARREPGVGVQRVAVAAETVKQRLVFPRLVGDQVIGGTVWRVPWLAFTPRAAEAAFSADEQRGAAFRDELARPDVGRLGLHDDQRVSALVVKAGQPPARADSG